jgi:NAD(P)H-dependent FMN reductase
LSSSSRSTTGAIPACSRARWTTYKPAGFITYGTRGGNKAADQVTAVLHGLHMRVLTDRVEALITDDDVDADRQLIDVNATLQSTRPRLAAGDARMSEALNDPQ